MNVLIFLIGKKKGCGIIKLIVSFIKKSLLKVCKWKVCNMKILVNLKKNLICWKKWLMIIKWLILIILKVVKKKESFIKLYFIVWLIKMVCGILLV